MLQFIADSCATSSDMGALDLYVARVALSPDGTILRTNALFLELFDYGGWDLAGRSRSILLPSVGGQDEEDGVRRALTEGLP